MKKSYKLEGLCCAHCANKIEEKVKKIKGVENATLSFMTQKLVVESENDLTEEVVKIVSKIEKDVIVKCL